MNVSLNVPKLGTLLTMAARFQVRVFGVIMRCLLAASVLDSGHKAAWLKTRRGDIFSEEIVKVRQLMRAAWVPGQAGWDLLLVYLLEV